MTARLRQVLSGYPELVTVLVAAAVGLGAPSPLRWLVRHQGVNALLAVLVFATAVTIRPEALRRASAAWHPLVVALVAGATVLPALSWAVSRIVAAGSLRDGVMAIGLAPCEIASVATTAMARGEAALSAGILVGSTLITVAIAGPVLALEAGGTSVHVGHIIVNLVMVVALPLVAGLVVSGLRPLSARLEHAATTTATVTVAVLVALIVAEVHISIGYLALAGALIVFVVASALLGAMIARGSRPPVGTAIILTTSMRDFAIAAGLATSAFGDAAAAPLGLYGILVLVWGTGAAGRLRRRST